MAKKEGFYQSSCRLAGELKDVRCSVLAHVILFKWKSSNSKDADGYVMLRDSELASEIFVCISTLQKMVTKLEKNNFIITKRNMGIKYYKINVRTAKKYFSF